MFLHSLPLALAAITWSKRTEAAVAVAARTLFGLSVAIPPVAVAVAAVAVAAPPYSYPAISVSRSHLPARTYSSCFAAFMGSPALMVCRTTVGRLANSGS
ncbi:hypothetical protein EI94DRAFT_1717459, partial [Lactarius quietus]